MPFGFRTNVKNTDVILHRNFQESLNLCRLLGPIFNPQHKKKGVIVICLTAMLCMCVCLLNGRTELDAVFI